MKYSRPDIVNLVRKLSKVNDGTNERHYKELFRYLKYVFSTKDNALVYLPTTQYAEEIVCSLEGYFDSYFVGDKDKWIRVTGFCVYV